jgi:GNAT superfamily N-acetyltransferase
MSTPSKPKIEKLMASHQLANFDCGDAELNQFFQKYALANQQASNTQTYVAIDRDAVVGYYSLVVGSVAHQDAPRRVTKGQPKYPIPVMILARLAVDLPWQSKGVGQGLLKDALFRTVLAADIAGIRALLVHAKDDRARRWYEQFDFEPSPTDELHLFLLLKDVKKILAAS